MRELLNREMPVAPKRRRRGFGWLFWLAGAVALTGLGWAGWSSFSGKTEAPAGPKSPSNLEEKIAPKPSGPVADLGKNSLPADAYSAENELRPNSTLGVTLKASAQRHERHLEKHENQVSNLGRRFQRDKELEVTQGSLLPTPHAENGAANHSEKSIQTLESQVVEIPMENTSRCFLETLPARTTSVFAENLPTIEPVPVEVDVPKTKQPASRSSLQFGTNAGLISAALPHPTGAFVGASVDWPFSQKLGLRTGLGYQFAHFSPDYGLQPAAQVDGQRYYDLTGDSSLIKLATTSNPAPNTSQTQILIPVVAQHKLELPISVWFQASKKLRLLAGGAVEYAFYSVAASGSAASQLGSASNPADNFYADVKSSNVVVNQTLSPWSWHWQLGAEYRFSPRWAAHLTLQSQGTNPLQTQFRAESGGLLLNGSQTVRLGPIVRLGASYFW